MILYKSIYGARTSCARFHENLAAKLLAMGYKSSKCEPDLWIKDMGNHYEYIATYIDALLITSRDPAPIIKELERTYTLKGVGDPVYYLGMDIVQTKELDTWKMEPIDRILDRTI